MINNFSKYPLYEVSKDLADVAMGRKEADLVITNATLVNVCTHEILEKGITRRIKKNKCCK